MELFTDISNPEELTAEDEIFLMIKTECFSWEDLEQKQKNICFVKVFSMTVLLYKLSKLQ